MATKNQNATRFYSNKQEEYIKNLVGGSRCSNSGASPFTCGDCVDDLFVYECKTQTTSKKSFSIKKSWLEDNELERLQLHKQFGALVIQFEPDGENYFVLSEKTFKKLLDKYREE